MDKLNQCEDRIATLETARSYGTHEASPDKNIGTGLKCIAYGLLAIAHSIREFTGVLREGLNKRE